MACCSCLHWSTLPTHNLSKIQDNVFQFRYVNIRLTFDSINFDTMIKCPHVSYPIRPAFIWNGVIPGGQWSSQDDACLVSNQPRIIHIDEVEGVVILLVYPLIPVQGDDAVAAQHVGMSGLCKAGGADDVVLNTTDDV